MCPPSHASRSVGPPRLDDAAPASGGLFSRFEMRLVFCVLELRFEQCAS